MVRNLLDFSFQLSIIAQKHLLFQLKFSVSQRNSFWRKMVGDVRSDCGFGRVSIHMGLSDLGGRQLETEVADDLADLIFVPLVR